MKRKNTMKLWQMLTLAILLFAVVMSMFLPIVSLKGSKIMDMALDEAEELADKKGTMKEFKLGDIDEDDREEIEKVAEAFDERIEKEEEQYKINLSSLSGIQFIMMDTDSFLTGFVMSLGSLDPDSWIAYSRKDVEKGIKDSEGANEFKKAVLIYKILFSTVYFGAIVILALLLIGFFVRWSKYTTAIISSAFGLVIIVIFALFRWRVPSAVLSYNEVTSESIELAMKMLWEAVVGMGVITCFILGILIFVMGIVTCIIGRASVSSQSVSGSGVDSGWGSSVQGGFGSDGFDAGGFGQGGFGPGGGGQFQPGPIFPPVNNTVKRDPDPVVKQEPPKPPKPKCGRVKCTQGAAMGQGFKLPEDRKVIVGKSPQNATLVIHDQHVSNVHCSIRYRQETDSYIVKDHSRNGTFVQGVRLAKEVAMEYPAGTVLSLADGTNKITLG